MEEEAARTLLQSLVIRHRHRMVKPTVRCNMRSKKADFHFSRQVGAGTYGVVWLAVRTIDGKTYAIKELDLRYLQKQVLAGFHAVCSVCACPQHHFFPGVQQEQIDCIRETKVLSDLDSPYIIKYFDSFLDQVLPPCELNASYISKFSSLSVIT